MSGTTTSSPVTPAAAVKPFPFHIELLNSGICGSAAWLAAHPFELLKNVTILSTALKGENKPLVQAIREVRSEPGGLYKGLDAALLRQVSYTSFRIGLYKPILAQLVNDENDVAIHHRIVAGAAAGSLASLVSSPVEVALVYQSKVKDHKVGVREAMAHVYKNSGITGFWRGAVPLMSRAAIVGVSQIAFQDQVKKELQHRVPQWGHWWHVIVSSIATGIFYSLVTMPVEVSRVILSSQQGTGPMKYKNMPHCIALVAKEQGPLSLYRAYAPYMLRCTVHSIMVFNMLEFTKDQLRRKGGY